MKVLMINGSPHLNGTTNAALEIISDVLKNEGIDSEIVSLAKENVSDCIACGRCGSTGKCGFNDIVNDVALKALNADGFIFASPVYYAHPSGRLMSFMNRLFYAYGHILSHKVASGVVVARRAGCESSLDVINKHFTINQMPIVSSTYWSQGFGMNKEQLKQDIEGVNTLTNLAKNMAWLIKVIDKAKKEGIEPPKNEIKRMNFIH